MSDVTRILNAIEQGDGQASEQLLPLVYDELRKLAAAKLAHEKAPLIPDPRQHETGNTHRLGLRSANPPGKSFR